MRLTSVMWLGVFMRQESARGAYVTVVKTGAQQAGAMFVLHNRLKGAYDLYGPAPQSIFEDKNSDRKFELLLQDIDLAVAENYLDKQKNFDPDLWVIETESGIGEISLEIMRA
ncbi:MAG: DUF1491 family protein [Pseudomonadota bacterium]